MSTRFRLYSIDIDPTLTPDTAVPAPATLIAWDHDPIENGIDEAEPDGRGSITETGSCGTVFQDFGVPEAGGTLTVAGDASEGEWLTPETVASFRAAYRAVNTEYYFTDGIRCWKVRWQRKPAGFHVWMNQFWAEHGVKDYSYEFVFVVVKLVIE